MPELKKLNSKNVIIGENVLTRYERARIVGARALQISYGAPVLIATDDSAGGDFRPIDVANRELKSRVLPIGLSRKLPNGESQIIPVKDLADREFISQMTESKPKQDGESTSDSTTEYESTGDYGLTDITGIGPSTKDDLKNAGFKNPKDIANASLKDLEKIDGIGPATAKKLKENAQSLLT